MPPHFSFAPSDFADFHVVEIGLELAFVDGRAHLGALVDTVANFQPLGALDVALHKFRVDAFLHDDAAGRGAALAGGAEAAPDAAFDGKIEVGVVQHDHGILAAQFQRAMLEALGGGGANDAPDCGRTGQRDGADFGMLHQRSANLRDRIR